MRMPRAANHNTAPVQLGAYDYPALTDSTTSTGKVTSLASRPAIAVAHRRPGTARSTRSRGLRDVPVPAQAVPA